MFDDVLKAKLNQIKTEKNTKLIPSNIKKDVTILGVTGTYTGDLNVFAQTTEPTKKDGIWLKTSNEVDSIITDDNVTLDPYWNTTKMSNLRAIPYAFTKGGIASINTDVFLFGGSAGGGSGKEKYAYKYDTLTDTYTRLTDIPYKFIGGGSASVGTDVYLFGGSEVSPYTQAYKYNTLTDTYTQLTNIPSRFSNEGGAVTVGTNVYLFNSTTAYKYNTLTNSYTQLANAPYDFMMSSVASVGTDLYLFGGGNSDDRTKAYKYDTLTDTYTRLTDIPYTFYRGSAVSVGTNIYLLGSQDDSKKAYKYDTLTDTYTRLTDIPYAYYMGSAILTGMDIYLFGSYANLTKVQIFTVPNKSYTDKSIILENGTTYSTKLVDTEIVNGLPYKFKDVHYYTTQGGLNDDLPTYYGDSTNWICFKNFPVTGVSLNEDTLSLVPEGTSQLTATISPNNAKIQDATWSSSDTSIATVDNTGLVTAVADGTCIITVTTVDGGFTDTCEVTVTTPEPEENT